MKFKTRVLISFSLLFILIGLIISWFLGQEIRDNSKRIIQTQREWLNIYSVEILDSYKIGDLYSIDRKMKGLINKKPFLKISLKIGTWKNTYLKSKLKEDQPFLKNYHRQFLLDQFFPFKNYKIDLRDQTNTKWGTLYFSLDKKRIFQFHILKIERYAIYLLSIFIISLSLLFFIIHSIEIPILTLKNYFSIFKEKILIIKHLEKVLRIL